MTHVYFHPAGPDHMLVDDRGIEVEDLVEARQYAAQIIQRMISSRGLDDWREWRLYVSTEDGEELFVMPFSCVLGRMH